MPAPLPASLPASTSRPARRLVAKASRVVGVVAGVVVGLASWTACPTAPSADPDAAARCPSLEGVCPRLVCVEPRRGDDGCPVCECAVQACINSDDCADRGKGVLCDTSSRFCEPSPACTDGDDDTECPAACYGRCLYEGERSRTDGYCVRDDDCAAGDTCRTSACVDDPTTPTFFDCVGWCAGNCAEVETVAFDPVNGFCVFFPDACVPPGWRTDPC